MNKITPFDVFQKMIELDDKALQFAPLTNVINLQKVKAGTNVTIGVGGDVVGKIALGEMIGGLILCDKKKYLELKQALERDGGGK